MNENKRRKKERLEKDKAKRRKRKRERKSVTTLKDEIIKLKTLDVNKINELLDD